MEYIVGNLNELYQFRILGDPKMEGSNAVYKCELAGGNTLGVPRLCGHYKSLLIDLKLPYKGQQGASNLNRCAA